MILIADPHAAPGGGHVRCTVNLVAVTPGLHHAIDRHVPALDREAAERALQLVERQTGIEQRAEDHVPRRAREAVEVEDLHSRPSALKLKNVVAAQDDVVHQFNSNQLAGDRQPARHDPVLHARRRIARRMVVKRHHVRGRRQHRHPEQIARMRDARLHRAGRQDHAADHALLLVEQHRAKPLDAKPGIARRQVVDHIPGRQHLRPLSAIAEQRPPSEFHRRQQPRRPRLPDARDPAQLVDADPQQPLHFARRLDHVLRHDQRAARPRAGAEHQRDQLVVAERFGADPRQLLARPIHHRHRRHGARPFMVAD